MKNRATRGTRLSLLIALTTFACSTVPSRPIDAQRADGTAQEVREDRVEIPCEPRLVLQTTCQRCHSLPPQNGAPFPLVRRSDVLASREGTVVRELMIQQLEAGRMPLTPVTMEAEAREVLLEWLRAGAPPVTPRQCEPSDGGNDAEPSDSSTIPPIDGCVGDTCNDADVDAGSDAADAAAE
jgi:hypothetical protein